jgi:hypothetical protein
LKELTSCAVITARSVITVFVRVRSFKRAHEGATEAFLEYAVIATPVMADMPVQKQASGGKRREKKDAQLVFYLKVLPNKAMIKTLALLAVASGGVIINTSIYHSTDCTGPVDLWEAYETGKCIATRGFAKPTSAIYNGTSCTTGGYVTYFAGPICAGAAAGNDYYPDFPWEQCEGILDNKVFHSSSAKCIPV